MADPIFHEIGLALAIIIALFAFGRAWRERGPTPPTALAMGGILLMISALIISHGIAEIILTILGVATLGTGHFLNYRGYRGQH